MKIRFPVAIALLAASTSLAQGIFERIPFNTERTSVLLLGFDGDFNIGGMGSASVYLVPIKTGTSVRLPTVVTAKHNLEHKDTKKPFDALLLKFNMPIQGKPLYVKVPLKHDEPRNYWTSTSGLDLAVIPLPADILSGSDVATFTEDKIVTLDTAKSLDINNGMIVQAMCMQPEYMNIVDFLVPQNTPIVRMGHISRLGFGAILDGVSIVRPHVIDMHTSPGNSGAIVVALVPKGNQETCEPMFLGVIQGYCEETDSYIPYDASITNITSEPTAMVLVSEDRRETNQVALAVKTLANPDLTNVTPVHELVTLRESQVFLNACVLAISNPQLYEKYDAFPLKK